MEENAMISREGDVLNVRLPAVLDKNNASALLADILGQDGVEKVVFDAGMLRYVSADGLDTILETKKKCRDVALDHARIGICDTLALYGFDRFLNITKQYRFVSVEGCRVLGHGSHGTIYQIGEDTIVKVYRDHSALEVIENERQYARNAFVNGIPTAIAYDVVKTEQGFGVIFEMISGMTLGQYLAKHQEQVEEYGLRFAELLHTLHTTYADPELYADFHDVYLERFERAKTFLRDDEVEKLKQIVCAIPRGTGMVHGDYHPNNVMIDSTGELMLIDMADISRGNGFFDLGGTYTVMRMMTGSPALSALAKKITGLPPQINRRMWELLMQRCLDTSDPALLKRYEAALSAFSKIRIAATLGMKSDRPPVVTRLMALYTRYLVLPKADRYIELFSSLQ